jgi:hypothetical protein
VLLNTAESEWSQELERDRQGGEGAADRL